MPSILLALWFASVPAALASTPADAEYDDAIVGDDEKDIDDLEINRSASTAKKKGDAPKPSAGSLDEDDEEFEEDEEPPPSLGDFEEPQAKKATAPTAAPQMPGPVDLDVAGKEPLKDNYALSVVSIDRDSVVVELPVLVARSRAGNDKPFLLIGELFVGESKVSEVRQLVQPSGLAEFGPSFAWMKVLAPVVEKRGEVKLVVKKANADGSSASPLFTRVTPYQLK
jgi:hypothetical protein